MIKDPYFGSNPLNEDERRRLAQLERELEVEDPALARALAHRPTARTPMDDLGGIVQVIVAAVVALMVLPLLYIVVVGAVLFVIAAVIGWALEKVVRTLDGSARRHPPTPTALT